MSTLTELQLLEPILLSLDFELDPAFLIDDNLVGTSEYCPVLTFPQKSRQVT